MDTIDSLRADRDKYKAFAEHFASLLVQHGVIKDLYPSIEGDVVRIDLSGPQIAVHAVSYGAGADMKIAVGYSNESAMPKG